MLHEREIVEQAIPVLETLLKSVPFIKGVEFSIEPVLTNGCRADFIANINVGHDDFKLIAETKKNNKLRDQRVLKQLSDGGWRVAVIWECTTRDEIELKKTINQLHAWIHRQDSQYFETGYKKV